MITYDEVKRQANIKKHGFDFLGSEAVFEGFTITREDVRDVYGELRLQTFVQRRGGVCGAYGSRQFRPHYFDQKGRKT